MSAPACFFFFFFLSSFLGRAVASWIDRCLTLESALLIFLIHRLVAISTLLLSVVTQILPPFKILTQRRTRCILEVDFPGSCIKAIQREDSAAPFYLFLNPITAAAKVERVLSLIFSSSLYVFFFPQLCLLISTLHQRHTPNNSCRFVPPLRSLPSWTSSLDYPILLQLACPLYCIINPSPPSIIIITLVLLLLLFYYYHPSFYPRYCFCN